MSNASGPDLIKTTEIYLVPSSFLVAALGAADTNPHRAAVSLIGLVVSVMWWVSSREAFDDAAPSGIEPATAPCSRRVRMMLWLPVFFVGAWAVSLIGHLMLWQYPLGR
jgi:hypothetical protein